MTRKREQATKETITFCVPVRLEYTTRKTRAELIKGMAELLAGEMFFLTKPGWARSQRARLERRAG